MHGIDAGAIVIGISGWNASGDDVDGRRSRATFIAQVMDTAMRPR